MKAYRSLIKFALGLSHTVSVWDGEEWQVKRSSNFDAIDDAVKSVDGAQLRIRDQKGDIIGTALVSAYGLEDDETVMDWSDTDFMVQWESIYFDKV